MDSMRRLACALCAVSGLAASAHCGEIWAAAWKPVPGQLKFVSPMIWLNGYYKPGQDNESIDPEAVANQAKSLPRGRRMLLWYRYFLSFWGNRGDAVEGRNGKSFASPWPRAAAPAVSGEWTRFLALFRYCGGELDYLVGDCEDWARFTSWGLSDEQVDAIVGDPRFGQRMFGAPSLRELTEGIQLSDVTRPQRSDAYLRWNLKLGTFTAAVMNETIWDPAKRAFPALQGSNYDGKRMLDRPAPDLNGHAQPSDNVFGTSSSPVAYGVVEQAATSWFISSTDPTKLGRTGSERLGRGPWQSFMMDVQVGLACRRQTPDAPLMPWIAPVTYPGDRQGSVGYPVDPRCWEEMVRQYALLGTSVFLWWNPESVAVPGGPTITIERRDELPRQLDQLLSEINSRTGGSVARTLRTEPLSFRDEVFVGGAVLANGKRLWRVSVAPGIKGLTERATGRAVDLAPGELGAWVETTGDRPPDLIPRR
jgi:hypothetical protein